MNELEFIQQLHTWKIDVKSTMVPTTAEHKLYGHLDKTRIIAAENDYLIYSYVKPLEVTESMYKRLSEEAKLNEQEECWLHYFAGAFLGKIKKTANHLYYI